MVGSDRVGLARAVAAAAGSTPGVSRLVAGGLIPAVTHVPGGTVPGVRLGATAVSVHIAIDRFPLEPVITGVVQAVGAVLSGAEDERRVEVIVEDVEDSALRSGPFGTGAS